MKKSILLILILNYFSNSFSQDLIYQISSQEPIKCQIIEVNIDNVKYKKTSNLEGPLYTIEKTKLDKIIYSNGQIENFKITDTYATVYIIRPRGSALTRMIIYENEKIIGRLTSNSYLTWKIKVNNGEVAISSKGEGPADIIRINPKEGKTYYIKQILITGWVKGRAKLELIDETEAKKLLEKTKMGDSKIMELD